MPTGITIKDRLDENVVGEGGKEKNENSKVITNRCDKTKHGETYLRRATPVRPRRERRRRPGPENRQAWQPRAKNERCLGDGE